MPNSRARIDTERRSNFDSRFFIDVKDPELHLSDINADAVPNDVA